MKNEKTIIIKDPRLRKARNELRTLLNLWFNDQWASIREAGPKYSEDVRDKCSNLKIMFEKSICYCHSCGRSTLDMAYVPSMNEWICVECNTKRMYFAKLRKELFTQIGVLGIKEILEKLSGEEGIGLDRSGSICNGYEDSKRIMDKMGISKDTQDKFLELCGYYDGYCDCEILLNSARHFFKQ